VFQFSAHHWTKKEGEKISI